MRDGTQEERRFRKGRPTYVLERHGEGAEQLLVHLNHRHLPTQTKASTLAHRYRHVYICPNLSFTSRI